MEKDTEHRVSVELLVPEGVTVTTGMRVTSDSSFETRTSYSFSARSKVSMEDAIKKLRELDKLLGEAVYA